MKDFLALATIGGLFLFWLVWVVLVYLTIPVLIAWALLRFVGVL